MADRQWPALPLIIILLWMLSTSGPALTATVHDPPPREDPKPLPPPPPRIQPKSNCSTANHPHTKIDVDVKPLPGFINDATAKGTKWKESPSDDRYSAVGKNCSQENAEKTDKSPVVSEVVPLENHSWKTRIIIACTVAAAVEVLIVIVMIAYWKQIRWTLRKFSCPCDERPTHRGRQAMEPTESESPARLQRQPQLEEELEELEVFGEGHAIQTFSGPSTSRHGMVDMVDELEPEEPEITEDTSSV